MKDQAFVLFCKKAIQLHQRTLNFLLKLINNQSNQNKFQDKLIILNLHHHTGVFNLINNIKNINKNHQKINCIKNWNNLE